MGSLRVQGAGVGVEGCKIVFIGRTSYSLVQTFCCRMYRLATVHNVTGRRTDRRTTLSCQ